MANFLNRQNNLVTEYTRNYFLISLAYFLKKQQFNKGFFHCSLYRFKCYIIYQLHL